MNSAEKKELLGESLEELVSFAAENGEPAFRARQIFSWIYKKDINSFYEMSDLPKELRHLFDKNAKISIPRVMKQRVSTDGTRKYLLELADKKQVETVLIPQSSDKLSKYTICISTQVGCPIGCPFCATGMAGFQRNLEEYEIIGQLLGSRRELKKKIKVVDENPIANVVYMGMGEPFLNYNALIKSIFTINNHKGINIGQRHITISTSGEASGIRRLASEDLQVTLAVSLHACDDELRNRLVPMNRKYPLRVLRQAIEEYIAESNRRVTFEYIMLSGVNMSRQDAKNMVSLVKPLLANINLIPYNEVVGLDYKKPAAVEIEMFYKYLVDSGLNVSIREEKGADIMAACGQLTTAKINPLKKTQ